MSRLLRFRPLAAALCGAAVLAAPAAAQSVLASRGLGYPLEPIDARARGLGGLTTGLPGARFSLVNPADVVGLPAPGLLVTVQPDAYDTDAGDFAISSSTVRFPALQVAFPLGARLTGQVGYASFLDQHWQAIVEDSITLPVSGTRVGVRDRFVSDGALGRLRAGVGARIGTTLSVGLAADLLTGGAADTATRELSSGATFPAVTATRIDYGGVGFAAGARWSPSEAFTLAGSVSAGGSIDAELEAVDDTTVERSEKSYAYPVRLDGGASARITQNTVVAVSGTWTGWSSVGDDLAGGAGSARDVVSVAGGIEWEGLAARRRAFPIRLGARWTQLPFRWEAPGGGDAAAEFPEERAVSAGIGARIAGGAARLDLAGERGTRGGDAAGFTEDFWRLALSLSLLGR